MTNSNIYLISDYDSKAEYHFHSRNPHLIYNIENRPFRYTFYDDNGEQFKACADFFDPTNNIAIEFKCSKLNKSATKEIARDTWREFSKYHRDTLFNRTRYQWNHSSFKQGIVSRTVNSELCPYNFIVIFKDTTKLTTRKNGDIAFMERQGINWSYESDYFNSRPDS